MKNQKTLVTSMQLFTGVSRIFGVLIFGLGLVVAAVFGLLLLPAEEIYADGPDNGYVVAVFPDEQGNVRPISFTASISRIGALELAGFEVIAAGDTVCSINGVGCPASDCFCSANWWSNAVWDGNTATWDTSWPPADIVAGDIVGFRWSQAAWGPPQLPALSYQSASRALSWLAGQQSVDNGGYGSTGNSVEVLMAIGANGYQGLDWRREPGAPSLSSHVMANGAAYSTGGASAAGKLAIGLSAGGGCYPYNAVQPSENYVTATGIYTGGYGAGGAGPQSWSILGIRALSQSSPSLAVSYLKDTINSDGGWGWAPGGNSDTNGTSLSIQALVAAGEPVDASPIISGLNYLKSAQNDDGGFPYDPNSIYGTDSDTNSTAYVVQAILAADQDPMTGTWIISGTSPISYLLSMQLGDGSFEWQPGLGPNQMATQQAAPALLGRSFPVDITDQVSFCSASFVPVIIKN